MTVENSVTRRVEEVEGQPGLRSLPKLDTTEQNGHRVVLE